MKKYTLAGILMPAILIMLHACAGSRVNSNTTVFSSDTGFKEPSPVKDSHPLLRNPLLRNEISIKAVRHFKKFFPTIQDEKWYVITNGYMVKYKEGDVNTRVDYDLKGNWSYTIRYITESKLPKDVRKLVRSTWYDYAISSIEEIQVDHNFIYIVHIHEGDDWKMIRVADGEATEVFPPGKAGE